MTDLSQTLERIKGRWMVGGAALDQAPDAWRSALAGAANGETALLALAAQAGQIAFRPMPSSQLAPFPSLPRLDLPPLPNDMRSRFRRLLSLLKLPRSQCEHLLWFMASRGFSVHPLDYMPENFEDLPTCYLAWENWEERGGEAVSDLSEDTWDSFLPMERVHALKDMRGRDPAAARALLENKASELNAEHRLKALSVLNVHLGPDDISYLEDLRVNDRSQKVKAFAESLLVRLGKSFDEEENAHELAEFHEATKSGLIMRKSVVRPKKLKTTAQENRRSDLFELVSLGGLAKALGIAADALVAQWQFAEPRNDADFCQMVARTGSDQNVLVLVDRVLSEIGKLHFLSALRDRLSEDDRLQRLPAVLKLDDEDLEKTLAFASGHLGTLSESLVKQGTAIKETKSRIKAIAKDENARGHEGALRENLFTLGLLVDAPTARLLNDTFIEAGLNRADAALLMLQFNATLISGDTK